MVNQDNFSKVAILAATEAGKILKNGFGKTRKVSLKKDRSVVTNIDFKAEKKITDIIHKKFPSHDIFAEEGGGKIGDGYTWIIDPLDGTTNFSSQIPFFAVSLALVYESSPILGVVFNPITQEFYYAERGMGSFLNKKKIRVGSQADLLRSVILLGKGRAESDFVKIHKILNRVGKECRSFRFFGALSLQLCYVASGGIDGLIDAGSKPWDYAAGVLIVREAEGTITNFEGKNWRLNMSDAIASNGKIHNQLLKIIK